MNNNNIKEILEEIEAMKKKLADELIEQEKNMAYTIRNGYVEFEKDTLVKQRENMKNLWIYFREIPFLYLLISPIIYAMIIPAIALDISLFIYQQTVFRVYKFTFIKRSEYIIFDHKYLKYLNFIEKINCLYCSYFNGLMQYASAIASRTELYFCPIKHAKKVAYENEYYHFYLNYGDSHAFHTKLEELRSKKKFTLNEE